MEIESDAGHIVVNGQTIPVTNLKFKTDPPPIARWKAGLELNGVNYYYSVPIADAMQFQEWKLLYERASKIGLGKCRHKGDIALIIESVIETEDGTLLFQMIPILQSFIESIEEPRRKAQERLYALGYHALTSMVSLIIGFLFARYVVPQ